MADANADDRPPATRSQQLLAEGVGTAILTFVAAGADVVDVTSGGTIGHVARYAAPALVVMAMIWTLSGVSGAHINPAVTLAFALRGLCSRTRALGYVAAQVAGAIAGSLLLRALFGDAVRHGIPKPTAFSPAQGGVGELLLTFVLAMTILGTAEEKAVVGKNSALAVGGVVAMAGLAFSPLSGAAMNPARALGPMIAANRFDLWWIYALAPLVGAAAAVAVCFALYGAPTTEAQHTAQGPA